ncbi:MAG: phenylalanine--tRNA ligase beta subunit-related protein [Candidatus Gracilibacteria bacterium]|nr:phenylalanine--tRNA ligase beta subunit-related protein [Candidatus Gracilibacteria bacterium]MDD3120639.1 phenylalanine--tRNA ligase beta subunit-related protein [Candidatus Gracilibacteria bacterium]
MPNLSFYVDPVLTNQGIKIKMARFFVPEISKRRGSELEKDIENAVKTLDILTMLQSPILREYKKFYKEFDESLISPAEHLLLIIQKSGNIPNINKVVDCYNIVSVETLLSIGAHDLKYINGNLKFVITNGNEKYIPLGGTEQEKVNKGECACMDEEKIICRMDIKQCNETKVSLETKDFIIYVQGNQETSEDYVLNGLMKVCKNIEKYCLGKYEIL